MDEAFDPEKLRDVYRRTEIRRSPITGIVRGYHTLPFILVGPNDERGEPGRDAGSLKLSGRISVSPKLVIPLSGREEAFDEVFAEEEPFMDRRLVGRMFSFSLAYRNNLRVRNEHLGVEAFPDPGEALLERVLDGLDRSETVGTGVLWCPEPRFYPASLERFIASVLEREFR